MPSPFLQTAYGHFLSVLTSLAFSLLIIISLLTFILNPFDFGALFQVSSLPFNPKVIHQPMSNHQYKSIALSAQVIFSFIMLPAIW